MYHHITPVATADGLYNICSISHNCQLLPEIRLIPSFFLTLPPADTNLLKIIVTVVLSRMPLFSPYQQFPEYLHFWTEHFARWRSKHCRRTCRCADVPVQYRNIKVNKLGFEDKKLNELGGWEPRLLFSTNRNENHFTKGLSLIQTEHLRIKATKYKHIMLTTKHMHTCTHTVFVKYEK